MKKILLTIILSSFVTATAIAEDKVMHNANPNASLMSEKHMMNADPNASLMSKKHMMNSNPNSPRSKNDVGAANKKGSAHKTYSVVKYEK